LNRKLQRSSKILIYFILPFLAAAGGVVWASYALALSFVGWTGFPGDQAHA
jgi:hypothetical protein